MTDSTEGTGKVTEKELHELKDTIFVCDNCGKHPATRKDYRTDEYGTSQKIFSCEYCVVLNSVWHYRVRAEGLDPKQVLEDD